MTENSIAPDLDAEGEGAADSGGPPGAANAHGDTLESAAGSSPEDGEKGKAQGREGGKASSGLWVTRMDRVEPEEVDWLMPGFIPQGELTLFEGLPKVGKSYAALSLLARATRGLPMPGQDAARPPVNVAILDFENDPSRWTRPILGENGADLRRVILIEKPESGVLSLALDLPAIESVAVGHKVRVILIDGLMTLFGAKANAYSDTEVRSMLTPLARMAQQRGIAVIAIRHHRKSGGSATTAGIGGIAFTALARSIVTVAVGEDGGNYMAPSGNFSTGAKARKFSIEQVEGSAVGRVAFHGEADLTADDLSAAREPSGGDGGTSALDEAKDLVRRELDDGQQRTFAELLKAGRPEDISKITLRRALREVKAHRSKETGVKHGRTFWSLPDRPEQLGPQALSHQVEQVEQVALERGFDPESTDSSSCSSCSSPEDTPPEDRLIKSPADFQRSLGIANPPAVSYSRGNS